MRDEAGSSIGRATLVRRPIAGSNPAPFVVGNIAQVGKSLVAVDDQACLVTAQPDWIKLAGCIQVLRYAGL